MRIEQIKCDQCGKEKGENNHWFRLAVGKGYVTVFGLFCAERHTAADLTGTIIKDLCGQECLHKHIDVVLFKKGGVLDTKKAMEIMVAAAEKGSGTPCSNFLYKNPAGPARLCANCGEPFALHLPGEVREIR